MSYLMPEFPELIWLKTRSMHHYVIVARRVM